MSQNFSMNQQQFQAPTSNAMQQQMMDQQQQQQQTSYAPSLSNSMPQQMMSQRQQHSYGNSYGYTPFQPPLQPVKTLEGSYGDDEELSVQENKIVSDNKMQEEEMDISTKINLTAKLSHKILKLDSLSAQTHPLVVSLAVDEIKTSRNANLDLICVIDISGSMEGEKIKLVKDTLEYMLTLLSENDRLCIITFDHNASRITRLQRMTEQGKKLALSKIKSINAVGGTDINVGMSHAFKAIKDRKYKNQVTGVFLLSDGLDPQAQTRVKQTLKHYEIADNFTLNSFGFGSDHDPILMNDLANLKDGAFYYVESLSRVDECFVDCLGGLLSVIAENVKITIKPELSNVVPGIEIVKAYGGEALWTVDEQNKTFTTRIEQLISGKKKDYVLMVKIPPVNKELLDNEKNVLIASIVCEMSSALKKSDIPVVKQAEVVITFLNETEDFSQGEKDKDVVLNYYRVQGAETQDDARKLADKREYAEAKKLLTNFKEELVNSPFKEELFVKDLIKEVTDAMNHVNPTVYEVSGKHNLVSNRNMHMNQQSAPMSSNNHYGNFCQKSMVAKTVSRKNC